jgi:peptidoglycan-associated lipoprotein
MFDARRPLVILTVAACLGMMAQAQTQAKDRYKDGVSLALHYDMLRGGLTNGNSFGTQGGAAEVNCSFFHGFGGTASVLGLHADGIGTGVPVNLVILTFGPSYTYTYGHRGAHPVSFFAHGLIGEADGFDGLYPHGGVASSSTDSLAVQAGGGVDVGVSRHLAVRIVQADFVRTYLPNSQSNVQNNLRLGVGIVLR